MFGCISKSFTSIPPMTSLLSSLADIFLLQVQDGTGVHSIWFKFTSCGLCQGQAQKRRARSFHSTCSLHINAMYCTPNGTWVERHIITSDCLSSPQLLISLFDLPLHLLRMIFNSSIGIGTAVSDRDLLVFLWLLDVFLRCII